MFAKVVIKVLSGPIEGQVFTFVEHDTFLFGRHKSCHAKLPGDPRVSRHHFLLEVNPPQVRLRDLGSRNGTCVNGVKYGGRDSEDVPPESAEGAMAEIDLHDADEIQVGRTTMQMQIVPVRRCEACGSEITDEPVEPSTTPGGIRRCPDCRALDATVRGAAGSAETPVCCERCGRQLDEKDLPVPTVRVCGACQSSLLFARLHGALAADSSDLFEERPKLEGYNLGEELGRGGMGCVYRADRVSDALPVAVKVARCPGRLAPGARERFEREIQVIRSLHHTHLVRLLDHGVAEETVFLVMEYCSGGSLDVLLKKQGGQLPLRTATPLMLQCLKGLEYAHAQGVVHRDLKPQNILLQPYQGRWLAKLADFGLAKTYANAGCSGMTTTGTGGGTLPYMPREQLTDFKYVKPTSDIWSIAATFYRLLTGCTPRDSSSDRDPILVILNDDAIPIRQRNPAIPAVVAAVLDRALQTDSDRRYSVVGYGGLCPPDERIRRRASPTLQSGATPLVPTLCVGTQVRTLRVPACDAERRK
ncbi:MAG: serine/threonine-protein kinase [Planctomycetota bacterium]|nr:serine/threonine-protein kinase [Planctomycetota bacterium]